MASSISSAIPAARCCRSMTRFSSRATSSTFWCGTSRAPATPGKGDATQIRKAVALLASAKRPVIYSGGGVINSGLEASKLLRELVEATGFPITSTLMGLGAYPASGKNWLGMLGMHGTYEANMAMHDCDVMLCVGARFDERITGRVYAFSPDSKKIHIDID